MVITGCCGAPFISEGDVADRGGVGGRASCFFSPADLGSSAVNSDIVGLRVCLRLLLETG